MPHAIEIKIWTNLYYCKTYIYRNSQQEATARFAFQTNAQGAETSP